MCKSSSSIKNGDPHSPNPKYPEPSRNQIGLDKGEALLTLLSINTGPHMSRTLCA